MLGLDESAERMDQAIGADPYHSRAKTMHAADSSARLPKGEVLVRYTHPERVQAYIMAKRLHVFDFGNGDSH